MALPKNIKAILFDCDNTLVMSEERAFEGCAELINDICREKGVKLEQEFTGESLIKKFVGMNFRGMLKTMGEEHDAIKQLSPEETEKYVQEEMYRVIKKLRAGVHECEGVKEQLKALHELNLPIWEKRQAELKPINEELAGDKDSKKEKLAELQKELDAFKNGVDPSKLLYELRKEENWKLEALNRFHFEVARFEAQEKKAAEIEEKKAAAKAAGEEYKPSPAEQVPVEFREKAYVMPSQLIASTPLLLVVVSSSAKARVEVSVDTAGMTDPYFGTRIFSAATSLPTPTSKPNPAIYKFAMEQFGVRPEECIAVEDSVSGATAGVSAGIHTIGYVWPYSTEEPDRSEEMAVTLTKLTHYETKKPASVANIMRHWREFPERLREIDEAAGKA